MDDLNLTLLAVLAVVNLPVYAVWGQMFFGSGEGFMDSLTRFFIPDILSMLQGSYWSDHFDASMFKLWIFACVISIASEYHIVKTYLPGLFAWFG